VRAREAAVLIVYARIVFHCASENPRRRETSACRPSERVEKTVRGGAASPKRLEFPGDSRLQRAKHAGTQAGSESQPYLF
jgi:hypothetical protein